MSPFLQVSQNCEEEPYVLSFEDTSIMGDTNFSSIFANIYFVGFLIILASYTHRLRKEKRKGNG